jgi:uncharacterized protein YqgV (UPF0045/DUF77 family)
MKIQAEVSLYPLRRKHIAKPIQKFIQQLQSGPLHVQIGNMSTQVSGECDEIFNCLGKAFSESAREGEMLMTVKVSNTCPKSAGLDEFDNKENNRNEAQLPPGG